MQMPVSVFALSLLLASSGASLQFKDASVSVAENTGQVELTLERTDSSQAEDVQITASAGTATAASVGEIVRTGITASLETAGANNLETFEHFGETFVAIAATTPTIAKFGGEADLETVATLTGVGEVRGWSAFSFNGRTFLAAAVFKSPDGKFAATSKIYEFKSSGSGHELISVADVPSQGAEAVAGFVHGSKAYVAVANRRGDSRQTTNASSTLHTFDGSSVSLAQTFNTGLQGTEDVKAFTVGDTVAIAFANQVNLETGSFEVASKIFFASQTDSDGTLQFSSSQSLATHGAREFSAFDVGSDTYLAVANEAGASEVYKYDSVLSQFAEYQTIVAPESIAVSGVTTPEGTWSCWSGAESVDCYYLDPSTASFVQVYTKASSAGAAAMSYNSAGGSNYLATASDAGVDFHRFLQVAAGADYDVMVTSVRFAAGETSVSVPVAITDDCVPESSESFTVSAGDATATVTITDDDSSTFSDCSAMFQFAENQAAGTVIGTVSFAGSADFELVGADGNVVMTKKDSTTLELTSAKEFDRAAAQGLDSLFFQVKATVGSKTDFVQVSLFIVDTNDNAPKIVLPEQLFPGLAIVRFDEGQDAGSVVAQVYATDADSGANGAVTYTVLSEKAQNTADGSPSSTEGGFVLDSETGVLTSPRAFDYDGGDFGVSFVVNVKAEDDGGQKLSQTLQVMVVITGTDDNAPAFVGSSVAPVSLSEDVAVDSFFHTVLVTDADKDSENRANTLSIVGDSSPFGITNEGKLFVSSALDFETTAKYSLVLSAASTSDSSVSSQTTLVINVVNVNDNGPVFAASTPSLIAIEEAPATSAGNAVFTPEVTDKDGDSSTTTFKLSVTGFAADSFSIDSSTGVVSAATDPDAETVSAGTFTITATDDGCTGDCSAAITVEVTITDLDDNAPIFEGGGSVTIDPIAENFESSSAIFTFAANDADASDGNSQLAYTLLSGAGFALDSATGELTAIN
eukprot:gene17495-31047_t